MNRRQHRNVHFVPFVPSMNTLAFSLRRPCAAARSVVLAAALGAWPVGSARGAIVTDDYTFVRPNGTAEWSAGGDFNGDGRIDCVMVDRATGAYRVGYQGAGGALVWARPRAAGIDQVAGVAVGHLLNTTAHALAFTAEAANRINVVGAEDPDAAAQPVTVFVAAVGPNQVAALDLGGAGNTPLHDLIVATSWNSPSPWRTTTVRNADGATFSPVQESLAPGRWDRANRVIFREGLPAVLAVLVRAASDSLRLISYAGGPANTILEFNGLPAGADYAVGRFAGSALARFLVFRPGQSNFAACPVLEPIAGNFAAGGPIMFELPGAIETLVTLPADTGISAKLLAIFDNGARGAIYQFDGESAPVLMQELFPPPGQRLHGAIPNARGGVFVAAGDLDGTTLSQSYTFEPATGAFVLAHTQALPAISAYSARANVRQFQFEPFVHPSPRLLTSAHAGDWTSLFTLAGGPPQVGVTRESFVDGTHGLDNPTPLVLGDSHPLATFGLANQLSEVVSIFSLAPAAGPTVVELSAQPPGGLHARAVQVSIQASAPGYQVYYRLTAAGAWLPTAGQPVTIFTNAALQFYARSILGAFRQTSIHTEVYTFKAMPGELDSDADGVPDFVEIAHDLDPVRSGSDGDGDGYSDLEELLKGTSPTDDTSHPPAPGYEQHAAVDWVLTPRPIDGATGHETRARRGGQVRVFDLAGSQLGAGTVQDPPAASSPGSARVERVVLDPRRALMTALTDPHYDIVTPSVDSRLGRELAIVIPAPELAPIRVDYSYGSAGGMIGGEALNWVTAAQLAYASATTEVRSLEMTPALTTTALLLEEKLRRLLSDNPAPPLPLTLFPGRAGDAGRVAFTDDLRRRLDHADPTRPAYDLRRLYHQLRALVIDSPSAAVEPLLDLTREVHRMSSASNNAAPGQFPLPVDILREFIQHGMVHSNYLAAGQFPPTLIADASTAVEDVLAALGPRPITNLTLRVRADSTHGPCTTLETANLRAEPVNLFAPDGGPFDFPDTFELLPGTLVEVLGRPDRASSTCLGLNVEVLAIALNAVPARSDGDADGNLLVDSWENLMLGRSGGDPFGDTDGDGYSDLQEMLDGTDPRDRLGQPGGWPVSLAIPALAIAPDPGGSLTLEWTWPDAYLSRVQFVVVATSDLAVAPTTEPLVPTHLGDDRHRLTIPNHGGIRFFKIGLQLKL